MYVRSPRTGVTDVCGPLCVFWALNLGPIEKQLVPITSGHLSIANGEFLFIEDASESITVCPWMCEMTVQISEYKGYVQRRQWGHSGE